jgi:hypothetical protein
MMTLIYHSDFFVKGSFIPNLNISLIQVKFIFFTMQPFLRKGGLICKWRKGVKGINNIKLKTMKTTRIIAVIAVIFMISLNVQGQSKKEEVQVGNFASYRLWVPGLNEFVKGPFRVELTTSENLDEFIAIGTGTGLSSGLVYDVSSEYSTRYTGKDKSDFKFTQVVFVRYQGKLIIKIMRMYHVNFDEYGNMTKDVIKDEILDYR